MPTKAEQHFNRHDTCDDAQEDAIRKDDFWESEVTVVIYDDSRLAFSGGDSWIPDQEAIDAWELAEEMDRPGEI